MLHDFYAQARSIPIRLEAPRAGTVRLSTVRAKPPSPHQKS